MAFVTILFCILLIQRLFISLHETTGRDSSLQGELFSCGVEWFNYHLDAQQ